MNEVYGDFTCGRCLEFLYDADLTETLEKQGTYRQPRPDRSYSRGAAESVCSCRTWSSLPIPGSQNRHHAAGDPGRIAGPAGGKGSPGESDPGLNGADCHNLLKFKSQVS